MKNLRPTSASLLALLPCLTISIGIHAQSETPPPAGKGGQDARQGQTAGDNDSLAAIQSSLSAASESLSLQFENSYYKKSIRKKSDFTKTVTRGVAYFSKPSYFRWEISDKSSQLVFDGKNFYQYYPKTKSATEMQKAAEFLNITEIFLNFDKLRQSYEVSEFAAGGPSSRLVLKPIKTAEIEKAVIEIDNAGKYIKRLDLHYPGGERSEITFSGPNRSDIEASKFQLPGGTQITRL